MGLVAELHKNQSTATKKGGFCGEFRIVTLKTPAKLTSVLKDSDYVVKRLNF